MNVAPSTVRSPSPRGVRPTRHRPRIVVPVVAVTLCWSCSGGATDVPEDTLEREAFIGAYVDLRTVALSMGTTGIGDNVRDSILAVYGVTEKDLLDFVDAHGDNVEFMRDLWNEIEARLSEQLERNARNEENQGN